MRTPRPAGASHLSLPSTDRARARSLGRARRKTRGHALRRGLVAGAMFGLTGAAALPSTGCGACPGEMSVPLATALPAKETPLTVSECVAAGCRAALGPWALSGCRHAQIPEMNGHPASTQDECDYGVSEDDDPEGTYAVDTSACGLPCSNSDAHGTYGQCVEIDGAPACAVRHCRGL
ncbi:MAG: hypothetical protein IT373_12955 [Polyangiaceae bacterium]|nr:hypothetical protein [Polyangiaceae bacterium]